MRLVDSNYWKVTKVEQIPVTLAKWEALENSHREKTGETVLSGVLKREIFLDMLPASMREQIEVSSMMSRREDITFDYLKSYVLAWVFRHASAPKGHSRDDPMQVDALSDKIAEKVPEKVVSPEEAAWSDPAWADSLGKSFAKGFGKGKGYGGKVAQPVDKAERICNCCGLKGHYARECVHWDKPSGKGGKSKGQIYEEKRLLSKGKGKGKKGKGKGKINSWESEEDAFWDGSAEWAAEEAASAKADSNGTADAGALDCSLGSGIDDDFWPVLCLECEECEQDTEEVAFIDGFESDSDEADMSTLVSFLGPARRPHKTAPKYLPEMKRDVWSESDPWSEGRAQLVAPPGIDSPSSPLDLESAKKSLPKAAFMSADEFKAMTQSPTSDFGAVLAPRVPGSWADEVVADETTAHTCTTLLTSTSIPSSTSSSISISPTYTSSPESRPRAVRLHVGPTGLSEVGKLSLMMTAGAPTINPRC